MAKFKVGEKARYIGKPVGPGSAGGLCVVEAADGVIWHKPGGLERSRQKYPGQIIYQVTWCARPDFCGLVPESELEKLLPGHQKDDLKAADPHFINHQLPRWLHQEEKKHERA